MREDIITMSSREVKRFKIIQKVLEKQLRQVKAGELLGLSQRQIRRIAKRVQAEGARGVTHRSRGQPSRRKMPQDQQERIGSIIEERYSDFGPTLVAEKLMENEGIRVSKEKVRQVMMEQGLWQRKRRRRKIYQWRERKAYLGEMVQMDGSHHEWLEGRGPKMVLMGYVDDATGRFFGRFYESEGVSSAMDSLRRYIELYGCPLSLYLDKHSTYKTTRHPSTDELLRGDQAMTQFERACRELEIEIIHAHSPQAKGRIERVFGTLQDRLVKEMRLEGITTIKGANEFLDRFTPRYNKRFAREALRESDLHRRLPRGMRLESVFCLKETRTIMNDYTVRWRGKRYLIKTPSIAIRRRKVEVREYFDDRIELRFKNRILKHIEIAKERQEMKGGERTKQREIGKKGKYIPPADHPWRRHQPSLHYNCYLEKIC